MGNLTFVHNYREQEQLRESFFQLSSSVFGLNFKKWYEHGFWGDSYVPYSFVDNGKIVANVSVNSLSIIIQGKPHRSIQIGTVMTHEDYRGKGLSKELMNNVLDQYKDSYDYMYLFANPSVLEFYPRFGFKRFEENQYAAKFSSGQGPKTTLRKLDINSHADLEILSSFAQDRVPVSRHFSTANTGGIFMYHCLNVFTDHLYYHPKEEAIVIFSKDGLRIDLFDVISRKEVNIPNILQDVCGAGSFEVFFHYTPDYESLDYTLHPVKDAGTLFVKSVLPFPQQVKHPVTAEA